jgi:hypothetical protein
MEAIVGLWVVPDKMPVSALVADMVENALSAQLRHARDLVAFPVFECERLDEDTQSESGDLLIAGTFLGECFSALIDKDGISLSIGKFPAREWTINLQRINADAVDILETWIGTTHEVAPLQGVGPHNQHKQQVG